MSDIDKHIESSLDKIRHIFVKAAARIEALQPGEKIPATKLAEDLSAEVGVTGPTLYPTLKFLFTDYPGVKTLRGAHGGLLRVPLEDKKDVQPTDDESDNADSTKQP